MDPSAPYRCWCGSPAPNRRAGSRDAADAADAADASDAPDGPSGPRGGAAGGGGRGPRRRSSAAKSRADARIG